jgi:predicted transcriptional regulator
MSKKGRHVNRDRHEIVIEILNRATSGKKKTEIMRDVGLSYLQAKLYLTELVDLGLLELDYQRNLKTTKKGTEFLDKCEACPLFGWDKEKLKALI